jgi:hypothetical protein
MATARNFEIISYKFKKDKICTGILNSSPKGDDDDDDDDDDNATYLQL